MDFISETNHRPWPLPNKKWKFYQQWQNVVFLHWKVDLAVLRKWVHQDIEIDTFEGQAYVSIVAFSMDKVRMRYLPSFKPLSFFHEVNTRTYVKHNGKTGVYFLSIEAGKKLSAYLARSLSKTPYRYSPMSRKGNHFKSTNKLKGDRLILEFSVGEKITEKSKLDLWLTERYALIQDYQNKVQVFDIHHIEWPIHEVKVDNLEFDYSRFNLIKGSPDSVHYSTGVEVVAWSGEIE
jgi:uncharacterized protein YqjF (DUF2071 family)